MLLLRCPGVYNSNDYSGIGFGLRSKKTVDIPTTSPKHLWNSTARLCALACLGFSVYASFHSKSTSSTLGMPTDKKKPHGPRISLMEFKHKHQFVTSPSPLRQISLTESKTCHGAIHLGDLVKKNSDETHLRPGKYLKPRSLTDVSSRLLLYNIRALVLCLVCVQMCIKPEPNNQRTVNGLYIVSGEKWTECFFLFLARSGWCILCRASVVLEESRQWRCSSIC
jgi:hypothetical protein